MSTSARPVAAVAALVLAACGQDVILGTKDGNPNEPLAQKLSQMAWLWFMHSVTKYHTTMKITRHVPPAAAA